MKNAKYIHTKDSVYTPEEPWIDHNKVGIYNASTEWAVKYVDGDCLVIASPIIEAKEIMAKGCKVKYMDVRKPPFDYIDYIYGDIANMPFENESQSLISTANVVCHAGMGRYNDPLVDDGDEKAISELSRVLKVGGKLVITFGPATAGDTGFIIGTCHRIFAISEVERMVKENNFAIIKKGVWSSDGRWRTDKEKPLEYVHRGPTDYLSMVLIKEA